METVRGDNPHLELDAGAAEAPADAGAAEAPADARAGLPAAATAAALLEAREKERSRLAEELHDGAAQALANVIFQTDILSQTMRRDPANAQAELASLRQLLKRELEELRSYIGQLRPRLSDLQDLDTALRDGAEQLASRTGILVDVELNAPDAELDEAARTAALRVAQEALRNVGKHASATRAWLRTYRDQPAAADARWVLEVGDNGRGFDFEAAAAHPSRRHFGLRFMRERAHLLGAELRIDSAPAAGTVVRLSISTGGERS